MSRIKLFAGLSVIIAFASCTVEKRRYTDGYHVEWNHNRNRGVQVDSKDFNSEQNTSSNVVVTEKTPLITEINDQIVEPSIVNAPSQYVDEEKLSKNDKSSRKTNLKKSEIDKVEIVSKSSLFKEFNHGDVGLLSSESDESDPDTRLLLLIVLAFLLPPVAVYLVEGSFTNRVLLSIILTLLVWVPGVIYALIVVLS